jgi:hypothetical protein
LAWLADCFRAQDNQALGVKEFFLDPKLSIGGKILRSKGFSRWALIKGG